MNRKQSIFFDLDGTLWDAIEGIRQAWNLTMESMKEPYRFDYETIRSTMGLTPLETLPICFPDRNEEEAMSLFQACIRGEIRFLHEHPGILYPREREVLTKLKEKYSLYIVSNSDQGYIENYLEACEMSSYFEGHLCAGDTKKDKWQNILILKEQEGIDDVIYVGDTRKDMMESSKADVPFIHAAYGFGVIPEDCLKIHSLDELPKLVDSVFAK